MCLDPRRCQRPRWTTRFEQNCRCSAQGVCVSTSGVLFGESILSLPMCGRYRLSRRKQIIEAQFDCETWEDEWEPRYNIAPTQPVPVIRQHPREPVRQVSLMRWGLIPSWAKDPSIASKTINAKSETAASKPAFREPLRLRRCLIPADGLYEWKRTGASKQPYCFEVRDGEFSRSLGYGTGGRTRLGTGSRPARS